GSRGPVVRGVRSPRSGDAPRSAPATWPAKASTKGVHRDERDGGYRGADARPVPGRAVDVERPSQRLDAVPPALGPEAARLGGAADAVVHDLDVDPPFRAPREHVYVGPARVLGR